MFKFKTLIFAFTFFLMSFQCICTSQINLADLKNDCIETEADHLMHKKYVEALPYLQNAIAQLPEEEPKKVYSNNYLLLKNQNYKRSQFEEILLKCAEHAKKVKNSHKKPTCFISYAWGVSEHEQWVEQFAEDLEKAGFNILLDRWFIRKGDEIWTFTEKILHEETDYVIVVGSKRFLEKYKYCSPNECQNDHVVKIETRLINYMMGFNEIKSNKVIPILIEGKKHESLPPFLHCKNISDFTENNYNYNSLMFELIRDLHHISQRDQEYKRLISLF